MNSQEKHLNNEELKLVECYAKIYYSDKKSINKETLELYSNFFNLVYTLDKDHKYFRYRDPVIDRKINKIIHDFYGV
jgi:hypothetical protein